MDRSAPYLQVLTPQMLHVPEDGLSNLLVFLTSRNSPGSSLGSGGMNDLGSQQSPMCAQVSIFHRLVGHLPGNSSFPTQGPSFLVPGFDFMR